MLVYDVTNMDSFEKIPYWVEEVRRYCKSDVTLVLVANKVDLVNKRVVSEEKGREMARSLEKYASPPSSSIAKMTTTTSAVVPPSNNPPVLYMEASARAFRDGNVEALFLKTLQQVVANRNYLDPGIESRNPDDPANLIAPGKGKTLAQKRKQSFFAWCSIL